VKYVVTQLVLSGGSVKYVVTQLAPSEGRVKYVVTQLVLGISGAAQYLPYICRKDIIGHVKQIRLSGGRAYTM
jgi:hypothetical protein